MGYHDHRRNRPDTAIIHCPNPAARGATAAGPDIGPRDPVLGGGDAPSPGSVVSLPLDERPDSVAPAQAGACPTSRPDAGHRSVDDGLTGTLPAQGPREEDEEGDADREAELRYGWTPARKVRFLDHMAEHGNVRLACAAVGISREAAYRLRRRDFAFGEGWAAALVLARAHAEQVLADSALCGFEEQVYYRGELVGSRRRFDGRLLLAHLARLDKLAGETIAGPHAARFDELLAVVAGESFPEAMTDRDEGPHHRADPLLPMVRERYVAAAAAAARRQARDDAVEVAIAAAIAEGDDDPAFEDWRDEETPEVLLEPEERDAVEALADEAGQAGRAAGAAEWDRWRARTRAVLAAIDGGGELPGTAAATVPLDTVNCVNTGAGAGAAAMA